MESEYSSQEAMFSSWSPAAVVFYTPNWLRKAVFEIIPMQDAIIVCLKLGFEYLCTFDQLRKDLSRIALTMHNLIEHLILSL
jgi:hypothetical protein